MSNKLTNDLISLIFNFGQILKEKAREKSKFKNCSFLHMHTLHFLKERGIMTMKEMADYLHITPPSATSLVNSLVKDGLIKRAFDKVDRRTIRLKITNAGDELLKNKFKIMVAMLEKGANKLNEQEKKNFIHILNKISQ